MIFTVIIALEFQTLAARAGRTPRQRSAVPYRDPDCAFGGRAQAAFERAPSTSALPPIPDLLLPRSEPTLRATGRHKAVDLHQNGLGRL